MDQYSKYVKETKVRRTNANKGRSTMSMTIAMYELLKASISKDGEGFVVYADGVSDATIATELGCSEYTVSNMRVKQFGKFKTHAIPTHTELFKRVFDLETRLASLEAQLGITA